MKRRYVPSQHQHEILLIIHIQYISPDEDLVKHRKHAIQGNRAQRLFNKLPEGGTQKVQRVGILEGAKQNVCSD